MDGSSNITMTQNDTHQGKKKKEKEWLKKKHIEFTERPSQSPDLSHYTYGGP